MEQDPWFCCRKWLCSHEASVLCCKSLPLPLWRMLNGSDIFPNSRGVGLLSLFPGVGSSACLCFYKCLGVQAPAQLYTVFKFTVSLSACNEPLTILSTSFLHDLNCGYASLDVHSTLVCVLYVLPPSAILWNCDTLPNLGDQSQNVLRLTLGLYQVLWRHSERLFYCISLLAHFSEQWLENLREVYHVVVTMWQFWRLYCRKASRVTEWW